MQHVNGLTGMCVNISLLKRSIDIFEYYKKIILKFIIVLPHSAPSWILSYAENLASFSLQDGATKWHDYVPATTHPPTHPGYNLTFWIHILLVAGSCLECIFGVWIVSKGVWRGSHYHL